MAPLLDLPQTIHSLARACDEGGGHLWVVGGSVRDALIGRQSHDHDLEVHGLTKERLEDILRSFGLTKEVGRSFPVYKVKTDAGTLDVALPGGGMGTEDGGLSSTGAPARSLAAAARRRDLTINALAYDPLSEAVADPHGGMADVEAGRIHFVDPETFAEDPLRCFRAARFQGSLGFRPSAALTELCSGLDVTAVPPERVQNELERLLLESPAPGVAVDWLRSCGLLAQVHPRLGAVEVSVEALDRAATHRAHAGEAPRQATFMWTCLLGPADNGVSELLEHFRMGRRAGYPLGRQVQRLLSRRLELPKPCTDADLLHAAEHVEAALWCLASWAWSGDLSDEEAWLRAHALGVAREPLPPLLQGADLRALGVPPGPQMGELLKEIRTMQLDGGIQTAHEAHSLVMRLWSSASAPSRD